MVGIGRRAFVFSLKDHQFRQLQEMINRACATKQAFSTATDTSLISIGETGVGKRHRSVLGDTGFS
jgi:hypothetical protein